MTKLEINSADGMQKLGASLAKTAQPHDLLLLNGDLGAGKTTMTQGLGRALGIHRPVKSLHSPLCVNIEKLSCRSFIWTFIVWKMMIYPRLIWRAI